MSDVVGRFLEHSERLGFIYAYTCPCGRVFRSVAPTLSSPALCRQCYHGEQGVRQPVHRLRKEPRKPAHKLSDVRGELPQF